MNRHRMERANISKLWSISMVLVLILSSLLVSFIFFEDTQTADAEPPSTPLGSITGAADDRYFGWNVSSAGDINDDGYDDVIVGAPYSGAVVEAGDWWNDNWSYRRRLSFDNSDQNENLTNFPVLVNLSPANFDYAKANLDASDLRFIDTDGVTELTYHIEEWNSMGDSYVWVNVTEIDGNSNSDYMWMYYNNSAAPNSVDVWGTYDSEFVGVWHLNDSVGSVKDSTANGHNGAALGGVDRSFTGMVDGAYDFAGDDDYIDFGNDPQLMITGDITLEAWVNIDTDPATYDYGIMQFGDSGDAEAANWQYLLALTPGGAGLDVDIGHEYGGGIDEKRTYAANLQLDNWYYLAATRDVSVNEWRLFIDGTQFDTPFVYGNGPSGGGLGNLMVCMDWYNLAWRFTDGTMDELRISSSPRGADWISAQYLSMTNNFITFGYEETINGTCGAAYIFFGGPGIMGDITAGNAEITINGSALNDRFGWSVAAGDVVGDNTSDILVGAPGYDGGQDIGAVYIFDGDVLVADADGNLTASEATLVITGENPRDEFGRSIALTGHISGSDWWNMEWGLRKKLTFLNSGQSENLINFPVLVTLTTLNFNYSNVKPDGTDLRFIDADGVTELKYHIEEWNPSGSSFVWVNATQIAGNSNSDFIWMYYNNSAAADAQDPEGTYDLNYVGVWHLNETSGGAYTIEDSTSYSNDGTDANNPTLGAAGKVGNAVDFSGVDDYINVNDSASLDISGTGITLSAWIAPDFDNTEATRRIILDKRGTPANDAYRMLYHDLSGNWRFMLTHGATATSLNTPGITWNIDDWHYFVSTYDGNDIRLFWDGVEVISTPATGSISTTDYDMGIGSIIGDTNTIFDGTIDEVRLSDTARTADWISAQYLSMNNSFISFGPEEISVGEEHDIIVGAPEYGASKGRAYIFFGDGSIPTAASDADVFMPGFADNSRFGFSVSCAGDMNGDGNCDVIVGAPGENKAYIYFSGPDMTTNRLSKPLTQGAQDDTNGNIDDLKLDDDSYYTVPKNGRTMFLDSFNVSSLSGSVTNAILYVKYYTLNNYDTNDNITWALDGQPLQDTDIEITQSATEVTPPGYDLFAQGVDTLDEIGTLDISFSNTATGGQVNVFFDYVWIEVTTNAAEPMLVLEGPGDFGWSLSNGGDVNGDGLGDVIIGAPDLSGSTPGKTFVKYGNFQGFDNETTGATPVGWQQIGGGTNDALVSENASYGSSGKSIEFNWTGGDLAEIRKVFPQASLGYKGVVEFRVRVSEIDNVKFYILLGNTTSGNWTSRLAFGSAIPGEEDYIRYYEGNGDGTGMYYPLQPYTAGTWYHIRILSDTTTNSWDLYIDGVLKVNDIGFVSDNTIPDYLSFHQFNAGNPHIEYVDNVVWLFDNPEVTITGETNGDQFGYSVTDSGNLNGDSYDDIIVGAPQANGNGSVYLFQGNDSWNPVISAATANNTLEGEYANDCFGWSVSFAGDVNNDGQNNFIVGAPCYDDGANTDAGKAYIFFGPNVTYQPDLWINGNLDNVYQTIPSGSQIDISLISAGDNATWWIVLQNDGSENDTFDFGIADIMLAGWTWDMVENGTKNKVNDGDFISVASGEWRNYTLNISSPVSAVSLDESSVEIGVRSQNGSTYDIVKAIARISGDLPPEISDVQAFPDPQETGGSVNITCNVTDDIGVSEVWVNITLPGGGYNNSSMGKGAGDLWFYKNVYAVLGLYQYTIWANDTSGNWNSSSGHSFTIQDTTLPVITNVLEMPDPQETGGYVNISCDVKDNEMVDKVWVNITLPGGGNSNLSMNPGAVDQWFLNTTYVPLGLYQYTIWANDTSNNWNSSSGHDFMIQDSTLPVISNVLDIPDPQEVNGWVNVSCDVTDNVMVDTVWVNITLPGGGYSNMSMLQGAADQWFYNATLAALGLYQYTIWANDTTDNWNSSSGHSFTIQDTSLPVISNVLDVPDPQDTGGWINISCDVTDNIGVDTIWVNITLPGGGFSNNSMDKGVGDQWFYNTTFVTIGLYQYTIWANDTSVNWNSSSGHSFTFQDTSLPVISNVLDIPDPQETGGNINISCDVTDDIGVSSVWVNITLPGGGYSNMSMLQGTADQWFYNATLAALGLYQYTIWTNDTTGNWNSSSGHGFTIQDTTLPVISNVLDLPDPQETGGYVNITCDVTDNVEVSDVMVNISLPGGGYSNVSMDPGAGNQWFYNNTFAILGLYQYTIWANDTMGNWNSTTGQFVIQDTTLPTISDVTATPDPQELNGFVNTSVIVTDAVGVYGAWVEIVDPLGGFVGNFSMIYDSLAGRYYANQTYGILGVYQFVIWANDTDGNWVDSMGHTFTIQDMILPVLQNVMDAPDPQEVDGWVNITCDVSDNDAVGEVWVNISLPGGGYSNISMAQGAGSQWFLNSTFPELGSYQYTIWVNDTSGNLNSSSGHSFTMQDTELSEISNVLDVPDPQETGSPVNISCDVTDNVAVQDVWVNISLPGGGYSNVSLTQGIGNQWFLNDSYVALGSYQYTVWTSDTSGNLNGSSGHGFVLLDSGPQMTGPGVLPVLGYVDTLFNFTVNYSHSFNKGPSTITLNLTGPSGGFFSLMEVDSADNDYTDGKLYYFTVSGLAIGSYSFHFSASDTDGKWVETGTLGFDVINRIPSLSFPEVNQVTGYTDTGFNFTVIYTDPDNHSPDTITVNITGLGIYDLMETDPLDSDFTDGKLYYINISGIPTGTSYMFHFAANDSTGDWAVETTEIDAPDVLQRTALLTSFEKTVKYSDNVVLNATFMEGGTPIGGADVAFYIDYNKNGIYEPGEYIGTSQTLSDGTASLDYIAMLPLGVYTYISSYQGTIYVVSNSTAIIFVDPKPAAITTYNKIIEEGQSVTLNATLEDEDGNPLSLQTIEFLVDRNQNSIFEGGEVVGSGVTDSSGYLEVTYTPELGHGSYDIRANYMGSNNYSVSEDSAILSVHNTTNNPPIIVTPVPDQIKLEDSFPWELVLTPFELDVEDADENLRWYLTGVDTSLYTVIGMNSLDDKFTFIPVENAFGNNEVTLWLVDSSGGNTSQTLWVNITPDNDRPKIESINPITVHFDAEYTYLFYNYVSDIEDPREDLVLSTDDSEHTTVNGLSITFLYPLSMNGTTQNVLVTVTDTDGGSTSTIVIVRVTDDWVPELEIEIPDITLFEGETVTNLFDIDDYFTDPDGDALFYVTGQSHVTIDINPITHVVNITAPTDWSGTETVNFHAIDPSQARVEDIVLITVLPVNDVPSIGGVPDLVVRFDQDYKFDLTPYISDEDNTASELMLSFIDPDTGVPIPGISIDPNNNLGMIINLPESMNGTIMQVRIWVSDGYDSNFTTFNITVSDDYPPELVMPIPDVSFEEDTALISAFNIHNFFIDIDDVYLIYTSGHDKVDVTINPDGSVDFSAPANWSGQESVTFRASDDSGALVEYTITVSVIPVNDAPTLAQIPYQVGQQGRIWVLDISKYLFDIDDDITDLVVSVDSEYVSVVGYTLIFDYPTGIEGDIVTVTVSDGALNSSRTFPVTLTGVDTPSSGPLLLDYIYWILLIPIILAALIIGFMAIKRKVTAPFVEEVFLIANDGVLIAHNSLSLEEDIDKDILSGMLTGVKNLISDAFAKEEGRQKGLHKLEFGEKNIMLEKSDHFFICLVFSGVENKTLFKNIQKVINELEEKFGDVFEKWTGDMEVFVDTDEVLEPLLSMEMLSMEEREQLKEARKRLKEAKELAIRELDIHLVNLLSTEETEEEEISSSLEDSE